MGYASLLAALLSYAIAADLFGWPLRLSVGEMTRVLFGLRGDAAAFVGLPLAVAAAVLGLIARWHLGAAIVSRSGDCRSLLQAPNGD